MNKGEEANVDRLVDGSPDPCIGYKHRILEMKFNGGESSSILVCRFSASLSSSAEGGIGTKKCQIKVKAAFWPAESEPKLAQMSIEGRL